MSRILSTVIVATLVALVGTASAVDLHPAKTAQAPWQLAKTTARKINLQEVVSMNVALTRNEHNVQLLEKILLEVSDPKSAKYGEHLNNMELRKLVGSDAASIDAVKAWLAGHGIVDAELAAHHDSLKFKATRAQVAELLNVQWATYTNSETKQVSIRALGATVIPSHLENVIEMVAGHRGWPMHTIAPVKSQVLSTNADVTPDLIYQVYDETVIPTTPSGQTNIQSFFQAAGQAVSSSDLSQFCGQFLGKNGVPFTGSCAISKYVGDSDGSTPGIESSLDSQYIIATAFGAETWSYTYNNQDFCSDLLTWSQDVFGETSGTAPHPNVISMSYGSQSLPTYCEGSGANRMNTDTMKMGAAGISVIIASGDSGSASYSRAGYNNGYLASSFPAELPYVTAVGSTTFSSGNSGVQRSTSFSGGGFSYSWGAPAYQATQASNYLSTSSALPSAKYNVSGRGTPDVSFLGEGFNVVNGGSLVPGGVAGTSCSTPSFAGMVTLLNNVRLEQGKTLGFLNPLLYSNPNGFTDITSGDSANGHTGMGWTAQAGWDPATGLGTPVFSKLVAIVKALNGGQTPVPAVPFTPSPGGPNTPQPSPAPTASTFESLKCTNPDCTNCQSVVEPQGVCIKAGAFSFKGVCALNSLILEEYATGDCTGTSNISSQAADVCAVNFGSRTTYDKVICNAGGVPTPVAPTTAPVSPPTPPAFTPAPSTGSKTFTQKVCTSSDCDTGCQSHTLPQDECLSVTGGGSAKATCTSTDITLTEYPSSTTCSGFSIPTTQPINKCVQDSSGSYLENLCSGTSNAATINGAKLAISADVVAKIAKLMKN